MFGYSNSSPAAAHEWNNERRQRIALRSKILRSCRIHVQKDIGWQAIDTRQAAAGTDRGGDAGPADPDVSAPPMSQAENFSLVGAVTNRNFCGLIATWAADGHATGFKVCPHSSKQKRSIVFFLVPEFSMIAFCDG
jgi:hypothetical protein